MEEYDFRAIEPKWQARWEADGTHLAQDRTDRPKFFVMEMFPYPSGAGLHGGHVKNYVPTDAFCRYRAMRGFNVLYSTGWDAFGQPAENEAIKRGRTPGPMVQDYADSFRRTMKRLGLSYDWTREINTADPGYYHWTQWFFLLLFHRGLAYRANAAINWCPSCKTGLANEEVHESRCWRCDTLIEKRMMPQWYFKITDYADRLAADLDGLEWPDGIKQMQREWIGRSDGAQILFSVDGTDDILNVFTTRADTIYGVTFMCIAPEHALVEKITTEDQRAAVLQYVQQALRTTEIQRQSTERTFTGVFTGAYAVNPVNGERVPIWLADYVLASYGTGAVMAVPAHDQRDFEFARKYDLPIRLVYHTEGGPTSADEMTQALPDEGITVNSGEFNGLPNNSETIGRFIDWLEASSLGQRRTTYKLRDWLISRQRYWGAPIPIVHCPQCGEVPVPENQLPVLLPEVEHFQPSGTGESPLATIAEFVNTKCPTCGDDARRETDTMGGFACSSWYFLRYADPNNRTAFASRVKLDHWLPVDLYTGGTEHAVMHLLYARFWTKVMYDAELIGFTEPFRALRNQGTMLAWTPGRRPRPHELNPGDDDEQVIDWIIVKPDELAQMDEKDVIWRWAKMSKSKGNGIKPDEVISNNGADSVRLYVMFVAPFEDNVQWSEQGLVGASRFINRLWRWTVAAIPRFNSTWQERLDPANLTTTERKVRRKLHQTIRKIAEDLENFQFNTAVAALMELTNQLYAYCQPEALVNGEGNGVVISEVLAKLVPVTSPFVPHLADELWSRLGYNSCLYQNAWPDFDPATCAEEEITIVVQVNGKIRDRIQAPADCDDDALKNLALGSVPVGESLEGKQVLRVIVVPKKLVNVVVK